MRIKIQRLSMRNFKGVSAKRTIEFNDQTTHIMGENHTGKTTIVDAVQWVMFGKNSEGLTTFGIDPTDENGNIIHNLENEVELELTADGTTMVLRKVRNEQWVKPKGQEVSVMRGHTTSYFINGNSMTEGDYKQAIDGIMTEALFKAVTRPDYFPTLPAESQRTLLMKMVGERGNDAIAGDNKDFQELVREIEGTDLATHKKHLAYQISQIKEDMATIPSRIEENQGIVTAIEKKGSNFDKIRLDLQDVEKSIAEADDEMRDASKITDKEYGKRMAVRTEINRRKQRMQEIEDTVRSSNRAVEHTHLAAVEKMQDEIAENTRRMNKALYSQKSAGDELDRIAKRIEQYNHDWDTTEAKTFTWDASMEVCPTCGQRLPEDEMERRRQEAYDRFMSAKMKEQDELDKRAVQIKKDKADADALLTAAKNDVKNYKELIAKQQKALDELKAKKPEKMNHTDDEEWQQLGREVAEQTEALDRAEKDALNNTSGVDLTEIKKRRQELMKTRDRMRDELRDEKTLKERTKRIGELNKQLRDLNQQQTELEKKQTVAALFEMQIMADLQERVNSLFTIVQFTMFREQINGVMKPTCECMMHGTRYQDLSASEKINAGLDIINAVSLYNNAYAPCFIDNAESVNDILPTDAQQILLIVTRDKQLTVIKD